MAIASGENHRQVPKTPLAAANHVIRYNECFSDLEHMYNDGIGGGSNGSFRGAPGPDSDIYGNLISHCWDDGLEVEGGSRNVRVWDNYFIQCMMMIGNAPASIGPLYIWRNVVAHSQSQPNAGGGNFLKMGYANSEDWMTGQMYIFHNTIFRSDEWLPTGGLGGNRIVKHTTSRNNILQVRSPSNWSASDNKQNVDNSFDYDLCNGRFPPSQEAHVVRGAPIYAADAGFDPVTKTGRFQLAPDSPGVGAGQPIPNFSRGYAGKAPDLGAHQRGEAGQRQHLAKLRDPGGERRHLSCLGEGPAEAVAAAKRERDSWKRDARRRKTGLHEPVKRTKICTKPVRLAFGEPLANLRQES